ncbi:MAG TPA: hypothetical protein VEG34_10725, partial [Thermoanaerobaculia bacterium]|nr:hypothetical protein [Thermoanaerobaculia bacterium]
MPRKTEREHPASAPVRWATPLLALLPAGLIALPIALGFWAFSYDDGFITYRYARNWAEGLGLVYNPGEEVLGTTAPGYALLLGLLPWLTGVSVPGW